MNPKARGELSELEAHVALMRAGYTVLVAPYTDNQRYDLVLDDGTRFHRVQVKTGKLTRDGGAILFPTCSNNWYARTRTGYVGGAELFAVYCPQNAKTCLVPVAHVGCKSAMLRLRRTRNGQTVGVR